MDFYPTPLCRRLEHRVGHVVRSQRLPKRRGNALSFRQRGEKIGRLMDERVLVSDLQTRNPPMRHVRVFAVRNMYASPSPQASFIAVIEILQPMQIVQVPGERGVLAIDL